MSAMLEKKEKSVIVLTIEASKEEFAQAVQKSFIKNKNRFQIPGFRKGKAPFQLVKKYYGEGVLYDDAIDIIVNDGYRAAVEEHGLEVVSRPEMDIVDISPETGMKYTVTVTVKPDVVLGTYLGVSAPYHYHEPGQEEVEKEIKRLQERNARLIAVEDRPIQEGDTVTLDYEGFVGGVAFDGGKAEGYDLVIGSESFIPGFEEQLIGYHSGEIFSITVVFPKDYHSEELEGKEADFVVKVHSIREKELPTLDDEFAKDISEFDTLDEYRKDILDKIKENALAHAEEEYKKSVVEAVCDLAEVDIPDCMIETEVEQMAHKQQMQMRQYGFGLEQYLSMTNQTIEDFRKSLEPLAQDRVKGNLVLDEVSKALNIEATEEDIAAELEHIAAQHGMNKDDLAKDIGADNHHIKHTIITKKTIDEIVKHAVKTDPPKESTKKADAKASGRKKDIEKPASKKKASAAEKEAEEKEKTSAKGKERKKEAGEKKKESNKKPSSK